MPHHSHRYLLESETVARDVVDDDGGEYDDGCDVWV